MQGRRSEKIKGNVEQIYPPVPCQFAREPDCSKGRREIKHQKNEQPAIMARSNVTKLLYQTGLKIHPLTQRRFRARNSIWNFLFRGEIRIILPAQVASA